MKGVAVCPNCGSRIKGSIIKGVVHIQCPNCEQKLQLDKRSIKIHMFVPFCAVVFSVSTSIYFLKQATIDVKFVYIIGLSFILAFIIDKCMLKYNILSYEKES